MNEEIEDLLHREELTLADTKRRALAFFIDEILLSFLLMFALWDSFANAKDMESIISLTNTFVFEYMIMKILYQTFFVTIYGATLGKIAMKISVVEIRSMSNPTLICAFNRAIFRIISEMLFYLGFLWGVFDPIRQAWHDKTAQTLVVNV